MDQLPLTELISLVVLLVLSGFFSGSETALMTLNRYRLRHRADSGHRGAKLARALLDRPDRLIGLILLGNNFVNILASSLATVIALKLGGEGAIAIAAGLLTLVILIFAEVTPKTLAALHPEVLAYPAAYIYTPLLKVMQPVVWSVNIITNNLLRLLGVRPDAHQGSAL
ncbi:MAG: CNNM domain-containing protein, partial [Thiohalocapsa sp.]